MAQQYYLYKKFLEKNPYKKQRGEQREVPMAALKSQLKLITNAKLGSQAK